ncbi:hypothetical protein LCGC14_1250780 [marine sediment metagenome]|uniref:Uncharacterized protein n=1 Tax=marine sediment metagenome TaxID=412755 RepID=A0A0F9L6U2_9ZZZZ|tara:strand:+ start:1800 stop:2531 length:732 start_codon:yes stop_codon:yes gene_type:complete
MLKSTTTTKCQTSPTGSKHHAQPCCCKAYDCRECRDITQQAFKGAVEEWSTVFHNPALLTIVPQDGMVACDEIGSFDLDLFVRRHRQKLKRYLPKDCLLVGGVDVALNAMENTVQGLSFHSHGILSRKLTSTERTRLKKAYPINRDMGIYKPIQVKPIRGSDLGQTAAYVYKSYFLKRSQYMTKPKGDRNPYLDNKDIPLSVKEMAMLEAYLERYRVADPIILIGLKRLRTRCMTDIRFMETR